MYSKVVVAGQGYVGLPLAIRAVEVGHGVVGIEVDAARAGRLAQGESYIEDISSRRLATALATGRYHPSTSYAAAADFDVAVITVPTPLRDGNPDLSFIEDAARALAPSLRPGATVILESTTYPGTTQELLVPLLNEGSGLKAGADFHVGYSPERIDPGNPTWNLVNTPKVVSGINATSLLAVQTFYDGIVDKTISVRSPKEAELTKLLENTFRHVNIALVNELAIFAHDLDIDVMQAIDAATTKPFGYMRFTPGPGVGGHCLPIDPSYLSWQVRQRLGQPFRFVELANDVNAHMPDYVARRVMGMLNIDRKPVNGSRILLLGIAYKKNTSDARESPSVRVAQLLAGLGADVRFADSHVDLEVVQLHEPLPATRVVLSRLEVDQADIVVLLVDHDDFDLSLLDSARVLDTRHALPGTSAVQL